MLLYREVNSPSLNISVGFDQSALNMHEGVKQKNANKITGLMIVTIFFILQHKF